MLVAFFIVLSFRDNKKKLDYVAIPFILCFIILLVTNLIYYDPDYTFKRIGESFLIFIIPVMCYLKPNTLVDKHKEWILNSYSIATSILSLFIIIFYYYDMPNHGFNWYFARYNIMFIMKIHPTYLGIWMGTSILILLNQIITKNKKIANILFLIFLSCLHFASLIILNTRMALYSIVIIILINVFFSINKKLKIIIGVISILFILSITTFTNRYKSDIKFLIENKTSKLPRYPIFYSSMVLIKESPLIGTDSREIQPKLDNLYLKKFPENTGLIDKNPHNQYLEYFIKGGIMLFLSFGYMLYLKLNLALKKKHYLYFSITLFFCFAFLTESVLIRQYGIFIYFLIDILLFNSLFISQSHCTNKIEEA
jgi:O-antigen ligase